MTVGSAWLGRVSAADVADLAYVQAWSPKQRGVTAEIAGELAFFGRQAPQRRSVLGWTSARDTALVEINDSTWIAPQVRLRQQLLSAAAGGDLLEEGGVPTSNVPNIAAVTASLVAQRRWALVPSGRHDFRSPDRRDPEVSCAVPVSSRLGRISEFGASYGLCFNSGYYIWLEEEFADGFASSGDPIGLEVVDGVITSPPTASRSALLRVLDASGRDKMIISQVDVCDLTITLPGGLVIHGERAACRCVRSVDCLAAAAGEVHILTRARGADAAVPVPPGFVGLTLYGRQVVQISRQSSPCPANGLVLLVPVPSAKRLFEEVGDSAWVIYDLELAGSRVLSGTQVGPTVLRGSEPIDVAREVADGHEVYRPTEEFGHEAVPPVALTVEKIVDEPRGRAAVGLTPAGDVCVLVAEGCEPRSIEPGFDILGATSADMTTALLEAGCCDAVLLDSGGAANISQFGRLALPPADRNDVVGVAFERYVPGAWRLATSAESGMSRAW
ncbi:hypothetical protein [Paenarthrobacter sp. TA1.8]|uniref:hypothetical protein n=1 Tax=Paenarthrobacter sp. TA1.8 TaxID=3400219 RepID=UPI003B42FCDE